MNMAKIKTLKSLMASKKFLIIASLPQNDPEMARAAFSAGADAVKLHVNVHHRASGTRFGSWAEERPRIKRILSEAKGAVGLMAGAEQTVTPQEMAEAIRAGVSFIDIYDFDMPAWMLGVPASIMAAAGDGYTLERLKALEALGLDCLEASIMPHTEYGKRLSVRDLEDYRLIARAIKKPVFVPSQKKLAPDDLAWLKKAGVRGVLLGAICLGGTTESLAEILPRFVEAV